MHYLQDEAAHVLVEQVLASVQEENRTVMLAH
jgi:hypothetical protein